jgi:galactose-1-phosphate uridylyltransferase
MNLKKNIQDAKIDLVKELGIDILPKEKQEELLVQMGEVLQQRIVLRIVEEFPEEKKDELLKIFESKDKSPDEINAFIESNLPNAEQLVLDEIGTYKRESVEFTSDILGEDKK